MTFGENGSVCLEEIKKESCRNPLSISCFLTHHKRCRREQIPSRCARCWWRRAARKDSHMERQGEESNPALSDGWGKNPTIFSVSHSPSPWPTPSPSALMRRDLAAFLTSVRKQGGVASAARWADPRPPRARSTFGEFLPIRQIAGFSGKDPQFEK